MHTGPMTVWESATRVKRRKNSGWIFDSVLVIFKMAKACRNQVQIQCQFLPNFAHKDHDLELFVTCKTASLNNYCCTGNTPSQKEDVQTTGLFLALHQHDPCAHSSMSKLKMSVLVFQGCRDCAARQWISTTQLNGLWMERNDLTASSVHWGSVSTQQTWLLWRCSHVDRIRIHSKSARFSWTNPLKLDVLWLEPDPHQTMPFSTVKFCPGTMQCCGTKTERYVHTEISLLIWWHWRWKSIVGLRLWQRTAEMHIHCCVAFATKFMASTRVVLVIFPRQFFSTHFP